jgi:hypothetical protein
VSQRTSVHGTGKVIITEVGSVETRAADPASGPRLERAAADAGRAGLNI